MSKRILAIALAVCLALCASVTLVFAEGETTEAATEKTSADVEAMVRDALGIGEGGASADVGGVSVEVPAANEQPEDFTVIPQAGYTWPAETEVDKDVAKNDLARDEANVSPEQQDKYLKKVVISLGKAFAYKNFTYEEDGIAIKNVQADGNGDLTFYTDTMAGGRTQLYYLDGLRADANTTPETDAEGQTVVGSPTEAVTETAEDNEEGNAKNVMAIAVLVALLIAAVGGYFFVTVRARKRTAAEDAEFHEENDS